MRSAAIEQTWRLIREDAARWVRPQDFAPVEDITAGVVLRLLYRHVAFRATTWSRLGAGAKALGIRGVPSWAQRHLLLRYGLEMSPAVPFGGGLYIAHVSGCVLMAEHVGRNLTVIGAATFGTRGDQRWPTIGDDVFVGIGARVIGGITVGSGAKIGANAVVMESVTPHATVVGVPAREVSRAPLTGDR